MKKDLVPLCYVILASMAHTVFVSSFSFYTTTSFSKYTCSRRSSSPRKTCTRCYSEVPSDVSDSVIEESSLHSVESIAAVEALKRTVLEFGASFDRGFGASQKSRAKMEKVIEELAGYNLEMDAAKGIEGSSENSSPLTGCWRMVWTTAQDVLVLNASLLTTTGAIHQIFEPPVVTNVIDFIPKAESFLPPTLTPSSLLRAKVTTRASTRPQPMRIGLDFEAVSLVPTQLFGMDLPDTVQPLKIDLPKISGLSADVESPGYFDVLFLDENMLIIEQNVGGGKFVLIKTDGIDP